MGRRICQLIVAVLLTALPLVARVAPAHADNASLLLGLVNTLRAAHGAPPLSADPTLTAVAQHWSAYMAAGAGLVHDPTLGSQVTGGWTKLGENIGAGGNVTAIFNAFVKSAFHFSNMIDPTYNLSGIGIALSPPSTLWVTEDFEARPGAPPATTQPPATTTTTTTVAVTTVPAASRATSPATAPSTSPPPPATLPKAATTTIAPVVGPRPATTTGPPDTTPATSPPLLAVPGNLAAAAPLSSHGDGGETLRWLMLTLSGLAVASVSGTAYLMRKRLHRQ
jgi:hypothetical protein